jgi:hypothetical protein
MNACKNYTDAVKSNGTALSLDKTLLLKKQCIQEKLQDNNIHVFKKYKLINENTSAEIIKQIIRDCAIELARQMFSEISSKYKTINCSKNSKEAHTEECTRLKKKR